MFLDSFKSRLLLAILIALVGVLYQLTAESDILIIEKDVVVAKSPVHVFEFLTRMDDYPSVSNSNCIAELSVTEI
jgi:hypothetical protein